MGQYRIVEIDPGCFAPAVKRPGHWFWVQLDISGRELPPGTRWSGLLPSSLKAIQGHFITEQIG